MFKEIATQYFERVRQTGELTRSEAGIELGLELERLRVDVLRSDVLRLKISRNGVFDEQPSYSVNADTARMRADFTVEESEAKITVSTAAMVLSIYRAPFRIDAHRADGSVIFESATHEDGSFWSYSTLNDAFLIERRCHLNDSFYGLGEKSGRFDRRGRDFELWNSDVLNATVGQINAAKYDRSDPRSDHYSTGFDPFYVSIPFFYHHPYRGSEMAGFFIDNPYRSRFEMGGENTYRIHFEGGQYTEYVFAGPRMNDILEGYSQLTGRMQMPPIWALGHHQCRWHPYSQAEVEGLGASYQDHGIPCDSLWIDIDYMDDFRVFTWDPKRFPDAAGMIQRLADKGQRVITIIDPGLKSDPGWSVYDEAVEKDLLCRTPGGSIYVGKVWPGRTVFPDFSLEETREWWGELNSKHVLSGVAGIWNDMNEPATGDIPDHDMWFDHGKVPQARYHNEYALLMAMGTVKGLLAAMPERRTFVLSRAGSPGIQRYAANWMGDNISRWDHLWMSLPMALGLGISGQAFVGADIGGFAQHATMELLVRWYQCGALTPFCRNHNALRQQDQYPWVHGGVARDLCRAAVEMRYRLMPYIYAQFVLSAETGDPIQRPLIYNYQDDVTCRKLDDQYLFGSDLLVAPIYRAEDTSRHVYLPEGTWHDWHTDEVFSGPVWISAAAPLGIIPLYARGGSVVPQWPEAPASTMDYHPETIELHVFLPAEDGEFRSFLWEDDGITFDFAKEAYWKTEFLLKKTGGTFSLEASVRGKGYPEFRRTSFVLIFHGAVSGDVLLNGQAVSREGGRLTIPNAANGFALTGEV